MGTEYPGEPANFSPFPLSQPYTPPVSVHAALDTEFERQNEQNRVSLDRCWSVTCYSYMSHPADLTELFISLCSDYLILEKQPHTVVI